MYTFESDRLGFRRWKEGDKAPFAHMNSKASVMKYFPNIPSPDQSAAMVDRIEGHFETHGYGLWAVELKETGDFIGFIGFQMASFDAPFTPCIEIGWRLDDVYWSRGYATEGAKACLIYAKGVLGLKDICSFTSVINTPSIAVMEKIGMHKDLVFDHPKLSQSDPLCPHVLYRIHL